MGRLTPQPAHGPASPSTGCGRKCLAPASSKPVATWAWWAARPSHPKLLDWLAVDFIENGWQVKRLYKMLVMSATYRQSVEATSEDVERDPQNRLLARGPRFRMDAEMLRDTALQASGLLIERIGGPSVNPYQPAKVWEGIQHQCKISAGPGGQSLPPQPVHVLEADGTSAEYGGV